VVPVVASVELAELAAGYDAEMVAVRRDLHAHPELGRHEVRTTALIAERLRAAGIVPHLLPSGAGLVADLGPQGGLRIALRADLDALPVQDEKQVPYASTVSGVCHACGHDVHTAALLGAALVLADLESAGHLPVAVRLLFQPAEECNPGGAHDVIDVGGMTGVDRIFALHCDPRADVGTVGLRVGAVTGSADRIRIDMRGPGGHTARPHLTADVTHALARVVADLPGALSRRVDPRAGLSVVFGRIRAGAVANAVAEVGEAEGTVRTLDPDAWHGAPELITAVISELAAPYGVEVSVDYQRGVPPVINDPASVRILAAAARAVVGPDALAEVEQSLGGEDFAWYLAHAPGAMARLGVRRPGDDAVRDLHQGVFDVDESAIGVGTRLLVATVLAAAAPRDADR
jgi:amidohydrolase